MNIDEIRKLLPLYVAQQLESAERTEIEQALKDSEELRSELRFWEHAKRATILHSEMRSEGHLAAEQIVEYAEGVVSDPQERMGIESHLQSCVSCRKEYDTIKELQERDRPVAKPAKKHPILEFIKKGKLAYAIPALAILVLGILFFWREPRPQQVITQLPKDSVVVPQKKELVKYAALVLQYAGTMRDPQGKKNTISVLILDETISAVELTVPVEHSALAAGYLVRLSSPKDETATLSDSQRVTRFRGKLDALRLTIERDRFAEPGRYTLFVREVLRRRVTGIEPEEYRYEFEVRKK